MWATGVVFAELLCRCFPFHMDCWQNLMIDICRKLGKISDAQDFIRDPKMLEWVKSMKQDKAGIWLDGVQRADVHQDRVLKSMLTMNPLKRITAQDLLRDSYFEGMHIEQDLIDYERNKLVLPRDFYQGMSEKSMCMVLTRKILVEATKV